MGGTQSKNTASVINEIAVKVTMDSIMSCTTVATQSQLMELKNITGDVTISDVTMTMGTSLDVECIMEADKQNQINSQIANAIAQHAEAKGQAVLSALGNTKSEVVADIKNKLSNNIDANTRQELSAQIDQVQKVGVENVGGSVVIQDMSFEQSAQIVAKALMKTKAYSQVINETAAKIDQVTKTEEENPIAGIIDSIGGVIGQVGNAISKIFQGPVLIIAALVLGMIGIYIVIKLARAAFEKKPKQI